MHEYFLFRLKFCIFWHSCCRKKTQVFIYQIWYYLAKYCVSAHTESWKIGIEMHRRTINMQSWIFIKWDFHACLRSAETHDFAKKYYICKIKSKFLRKLKDWNGNAQVHEKNMQSWIFYQVWFFLMHNSHK